MQEAGYEIKYGKYISFRATGQERFTRVKTVGDNYTEERIRERLAEPKEMLIPKWIKPSTEKIIDRDLRKGIAYDRWAVSHNLYAMVDSFNYLANHHGSDLTEFERHYADCITRRSTAQAAFDQAAKKIAADSSIGIGEKLKRHNALKTRHAKEVAALNTEIVEMDRIRENTIAVHGEDFYRKHSQRRKGGAR